MDEQMRRSDLETVYQIWRSIPYEHYQMGESCKQMI